MTYATGGSAGIDLRSQIDFKMVAGSDYKFGTGIALDMRGQQMFGMIVPRSGLATKHGIVLKNVVGIVDSDYQGEIIVVLRNAGRFVYHIRQGDKIAQLIFVPYFMPVFRKVTEFEAQTTRGEGGFGSSGR